MTGNSRTPENARESPLEEMLRLCSPPAGYAMDATSYVHRLRAQAERNRRAREEPKGTIYARSVQKRAESQ